MSNGRPLFAFAFRSGLGHAVSDFPEVDAAAVNADFVWAHLDLSDAVAQAWLRRRSGPPDVVAMVAAPIQRGRLFIATDMVYGHLRDFRDEPGAITLQAGSLCVVASRRLLVTGRRIPLRSIEELRSRVDARTIIPESPFGLITEFFRALNDIGEALLQKATERLTGMESKVLKRNVAGSREEIFEMRRESIRVSRDMFYKRTAMLELVRERPVLLSVEEFDRFNRQIHRYAALVEEETNRNLYILTMFSVIFLPATLIASIWGMNVNGIPFSGSPNGFWMVAGLITAIFALVAIVLFRFRFKFF